MHPPPPNVLSCLRSPAPRRISLARSAFSLHPVCRFVVSIMFGSKSAAAAQVLPAADADVWQLCPVAALSFTKATRPARCSSTYLWSLSCSLSVRDEAMPAEAAGAPSGKRQQHWWNRSKRDKPPKKDKAAPDAPAATTSLASFNEGLTSLFKDGDSASALQLLARSMSAPQAGPNTPAEAPASPEPDPAIPCAAEANYEPHQSEWAAEADGQAADVGGASSAADVAALAEAGDTEAAATALLTLAPHAAETSGLCAAFEATLAANARAAEAAGAMGGAVAQRAVTLLGAMQRHGVERTSMCYAHAIHACACAGADCQGWMLQLLSRARAEADAAAKADCACFRAALLGLERTRQWHHASSILEAADADLVPLDSRCYAAAIGALRGGAPRAWQQALAHYHRMESKGVETSPEACTKLAEVFAESGQALQALQTLTGCKASGVRVPAAAYCAAFRACEKAGAWRELQVMLRTLRAEEEAGTATAPGAAASVGVLAPAARTLCAVRRWTDALALAPALAAAAAALPASEPAIRGSVGADVDGTDERGEAASGLRALYRAARAARDPAAQSACAIALEGAGLAPVATVAWMAPGPVGGGVGGGGGSGAETEAEAEAMARHVHLPPTETAGGAGGASAAASDALDLKTAEMATLLLGGGGGGGEGGGEGGAEGGGRADAALR